MSSRHDGALYSPWEAERPMDTILPMGALQLYPRNFCPYVCLKLTGEAE